MKDFFISYNKADRAWAEWIAWELEAANYSVVIQAWDFRPGSNFVLEMHKGLKEAERVLAVLSPDFLASEFTAPEWAAAFAQDPTGRHAKLIPVRVREADLSGLLGQINYIDFVGVHNEAATRKLLLEGVERGRAKPKQQPAFPGAPKRMVKSQPRFPGSLPPIWNVPHNRNRNFTGRDELLSTLRAQLLAGHHSALTALHGLGGIGKTQMAVEYAYRYASEYELVWWLRSEDPTTLAGDYALLASKLDLPEAAADQQATIQAVKEWLGVTSGWLLVFDNARNEEEVRPYLPAGNAGHVIITSRSPDWRRVADPLSVGTLAPNDAVAFLQRRSGRRDEQASRELVEELGNLPLAIEQAAAYVDVHGTSISAYLELFRKHQQKLLSRGQPLPDYPANLETTWGLSFTEVRRQCPAGADLLNLCAFLAPDNIPLDVIREGNEMLSEPLASAVGDDLEFDHAVTTLRRHSLVERTDNTISVHRLVQAVVRDQMAKESKRVWAESAARLLGKAFPYDSDDVNTWPICARLFPHAITTAAFCEAEAAGSIAAQYLFSQSAIYLRGRADYLGAKALNERALRIAESTSRPNSPAVAAILNNLGLTLYNLGDHSGARELFERVQAIDAAFVGPHDQVAAIHMNNLAFVLQGLGELDEARELLTRALQIDEAFYGPDDPNVATSAHNLGYILLRLGRYDEARILFERALKIDEIAFGTDHPDFAMDLENLGKVFESTGDAAGARILYQRAFHIFESRLGADHPHAQRTRDLLKDTELDAREVE